MVLQLVMGRRAMSCGQTAALVTCAANACIHVDQPDWVLSPTWLRRYVLPSLQL